MATMFILLLDVRRTALESIEMKPVRDPLLPLVVHAINLLM